MTISAKILEEYGIDPSSLPKVKVIQRGVSGLPDAATTGMTWKEARELKRRIYARNERFRRADLKQTAPANDDSAYEPPPVAEVIAKPLPPKVKLERKPKVRQSAQIKQKMAERRSVLHECVAQKMTVRQIAARLNIAPKTVSNNLWKLGLQAEAEPKAKRTLEPKDYSALIEQMRELAAQGHNKTAACEILQRCPKHIGDLARANGIEFSKEKRKPKLQKREIPTKEIIAAYESGMSLVQVARHIRISIHTVNDVIKAAGIKTSCISVATRRVRAAVAEAHAKGLHDKAISERAGISIKAVWRARQALGLNPNPAPVRKKVEVDADKIIRLHNEGKSASVIGRAIGKSKSHVARFLRARGIA